MMKCNKLNLQKIAYVSLVLVLFALNIHSRLYVAKIKIDDKLAESVVLDRYKKEMDEASVDKKKAERRYKAYVEDRDGTKRDVAKYKEGIVDFWSDKNNVPYLFGIDGYQWRRLTKHYIDNSLVKGFTAEKNKLEDNLMYGLEKREVHKERLLFVLTSLLYKFCSIFNSNLDIDVFVYYSPITYSFFFLVLLLWFVASNYGLLAGLFSLVFISLVPALVMRSSAGWYDSDILSFCLLICLINVVTKFWFAERKRYLMISLCSLLSAFYLYLWKGAVVIVCLIAFSIFIYELCNYVKRRDYKLFYKKSLDLFYYLIASGVMAFVFFGVNIFATINLILVFVFQKGSIFVVARETLMIIINSIAELTPNPDYAFGDYLYGKPILIMSILALLYFVFIGVRNEGKQKLISMFILFYMLLFGFLSFRSIRFIYFLSLGLGLPLSVLSAEACKKIKNKLSIHNALVFLLVLCVYFSVANRAYSIDMQGVRLVNDAWQQQMDFIRSNTPEDSVINTWWDYGVCYKELAQRAILFDSQTQGDSLFPRFIAKMFMTVDEIHALNILRLNNAHKLKFFWSGFDTINNKTKNQYKTISIIDTLFELSVKDAKKFLRYLDFTTKEQNDLLELFYGGLDKPVYVAVDASMVNGIKTISSIAMIDVSRLYVVNNLEGKKNDVVSFLKNSLMLDENYASELYDETKKLAKESKSLLEAYTWVDHFDEGPMLGVESEDFVLFEDGKRDYKVIFDKQENLLKIINFNNSNSLARNQYFFDGKKFLFKLYHKDQEKTYILSENVKQGFGDFEEQQELAGVYSSMEIVESTFILKHINDQWLLIPCSTNDLARSVFVRLMFLDGWDLDHFKKVYSDDINGQYVYKVDI